MSPPLWRQIQKTNFTQMAPLATFLELPLHLREKLLERPPFPLNLPKRLAEKIEKGTLDDPLLRQFVPLDEERSSPPDFSLDAVGDLPSRKTKKLLHKYPARALLVSTSGCAMHCRYCFRQNFPYETEEKSFSEELAYLRANPTLREVILSGGDPLSLSDATLASLFASLAEIPHLKRVRFHTRFPIGIPERIDPPFLSLLQNLPKEKVIILHINHPRELDPDVKRALHSLLTLGIPLLNQAVLLRGVNDDEETLLSLSEELLSAGVIPYYLHLLDRVKGTAHFAVSEERGRELIAFLRENGSGFGVPRLVKEEAGKGSKTFLA